MFRSTNLDKNEDNKEWENIHEHKILQHFLQLSVDAIQIGCKELWGPLFDIGFDLQWRMFVFRERSTEAAQQFRVNLGKVIDRNKILKKYLDHMDKYGTEEGETFNGIYFYPDEEDDFVEKYLESYDKRVKQYYPEYLDSSVSMLSYLEELFKVLGKNWKKCKSLQDLLEKLIIDYEDLDLILDEETYELELARDIEQATAKVVVKNGLILKY